MTHSAQRSTTLLASLLLTLSLWLPTVKTHAAPRTASTAVGSAPVVLAAASPIVLM